MVSESMSKVATIRKHNSKLMTKVIPVILGHYYPGEAIDMSFDHSTSKLKALKRSLSSITGVALSSADVEQIVVKCFAIFIKKDLDNAFEEIEELRNNRANYVDKLKKAQGDWLKFKDELAANMRVAKREQKRNEYEILHASEISLKRLAELEAEHNKKVKALHKQHKAELKSLIASHKTVKLLLKYQEETGRDVRKLQF